MHYYEMFKEDYNMIRERFLLASDRIRQILLEDTVVQPYNDYFKKVAAFIIETINVGEKIKTDQLQNEKIEVLSEINKKLYDDILPINYGQSYANPVFAAEQLGEDYGPILSFLYVEMRAMIVYAFESRFVDFTIAMELFIEVYNSFEEPTLPQVKSIQKMIYWYISDYCDQTLAYRIREQFDPSLDFVRQILMKADFTNEAYLYQYGDYISDIELKTAHYLNTKKTDDEIYDMARIMVDGYFRGYETLNIKWQGRKNTVNLRFNIGFERLAKAVVLLFEEKGFKVIMWRNGVNALSRRPVRNGIMSVSPNQQYDYDHRFDEALFLDKALIERKLAVTKQTYEKYKAEAKAYGGPALIDAFGEEPFSPVSNDYSYKLSEKQQALANEYTSQVSMVMNEYIDLGSTSFTIIAYPLPGADILREKYDEIFDEIIHVNTLDINIYEAIQQKIIDVLDRAEYVHIKGYGKNQTDLKVQLYPLNQPEVQSRFENCTADVNIPLGEVFTSPVLSKTDGILNVSSVYLNDLLYKNLSITFKDGMIQSYTCDNFECEDDNQRYIADNILMHHETLPMGEFAIGTNTVAYAMAKKYNIIHLLPILIVEKMGPHFAVGDTCYSHSEDHPTYNPDGKEIVARDNECSVKRKTNISEAYFNCHTDITIPYDEIESIIAVGAGKNHENIDIIRNGQFVLAGCELLNAPLMQ